METVYLILFAIGLVWLVVFAVDRHLVVSGLERDLSEYLEKARKVVEIADDPRVIIHYEAVESAISAIYNSYFPRIP
jgi:hypothetical protein